MKRFRNMLFWTVCLPIWAQAQTVTTITGSVVDEQYQPLPYANVVLLSLPDSAFVTGVVSREDGSFQLKTSTG